MVRDILVIIFIIVLSALFSSMRKNKGKDIGKHTDKSKGSVRVYIPHYMKEDEYKCPVCKARFWKVYMVCPNCGTKFTGTREDDGELMEEMELWDGDEE